jgi:hypothetical protein
MCPLSTVTRRIPHQRNKFRDDLGGHRQCTDLVTKPDRDLPLGRACKHFGHGSSDRAGQLLVVEQGSTGSDIGQAASVVELVSALRQDQLG